MGDYSYHSFCRELLSSAKQDILKYCPDFKPSSLSTTKSSLGGFEVQGSNRFYYYASSSCCAWSAKAEAIDYMIQLEEDRLDKLGRTGNHENAETS